MEGLRVVHVGRGREFEFGTRGWVWMEIFEIYLCRRLFLLGLEAQSSWEERMGPHRKQLQSCHNRCIFDLQDLDKGTAKLRPKI